MCFFYLIVYKEDGLEFKFSTHYKSVKVKGLEWRKFISIT